MKEFFDSIFTEEAAHDMDNVLAFASFAILVAWLFFG